MASSNPEPTKGPTSHLHVLNLIVALIAGIISVVGGVYSLKTNIFGHKPGSVQGVIMDEAIAKPLWMAPVELSDPNGAVVAVVNSDQTGHYALNTLKEGDYVIKVSALRHQVQSRNVKVYEAKDSTLNFDLVPEAPKEPMLTSNEVTAYSAQILGKNPNMQPAATPAAGSQGVNPGAGLQPATSNNQAAPYGQYPSKHHRWNSQGSSQDTNNSGTTPSSMNSVVTQVGGQLLQQWLSKKSGSSSGQ